MLDRAPAVALYDNPTNTQFWHLWLSRVNLRVKKELLITSRVGSWFSCTLLRPQQFCHISRRDLFGCCLCASVSEPLPDPAPFYQPEVDAVLAYHDAAYSQHLWALPRLLLPHPDEATQAAVFAAALLSGRVLPVWGPLSQVLVAPAATAARPELRGMPRIGELVNALQRQQVRSLAVAIYSLLTMLLSLYCTRLKMMMLKADELWHP
jgi:hypothetical protein